MISVFKIEKKEKKKFVYVNNYLLPVKRIRFTTDLISVYVWTLTLINFGWETEHPLH